MRRTAALGAAGDGARERRERESAHRPGPVSVVLEERGYRLERRVLPNRAAVPNAFAVRVTRKGAPVSGAEVVATFTMPDVDIPAQSYRLVEISPGPYERAARRVVVDRASG